VQITKLRLAGFKSFVHPTELTVGPGLTGVVGPNGCGKSNLIDALRWVMGEASARGLRGGEMDDVIFAGTAARPPFDLAEEHRALYHAGAAMASNYLVTLHRAASSLFIAAGAPPEALLPLMIRTIDNGFELTGPIIRGDRGTIERHREALGEKAAPLLPLYDALGEATRS